MIKKLLSMQARFANMIGKSLLPDKLKDDFKTLLNARADILR